MILTLYFTLCKSYSWKVSVLKKSSYHYSNCLSFRNMIIVQRFFFSLQCQKKRRSLRKKTLPKQVKPYLNIEKTEAWTWKNNINNLKSFRSLISALVKIRLHSIDSLKKRRVTRQPFSLPISNTNLYINSFLSISIRLLNSFIFCNLNKTELTFRSEFKNVIYKSNMKHWT